MHVPFFSILLPTKNRSEIVSDAIQSVLQQTYGDFELIVSDNDDSATATAKVVNQYQDPRIHYLRTSGKLAMHENWDNAFNHASGKHVVVLEDKMRLVPKALEILHYYLSEHGDVVLSYDIKFEKEPVYAGPSDIPPVQLISQADIISRFCRFENKYFNILPKGIDSCAPSTLLHKIKHQSPTGYLFSYIAPDYASAFMILSEIQNLYFLDACLAYIPNNWMWQSSYSNGAASYKKDNQIKRFFGQVPVKLEDILCLVPVKAPWMWINWIIYDFTQFFKCPRLAPKINWIKYHSFCVLTIMIGKKLGANMQEEIRAVKDSLQQQNLFFKILVALDVVQRLAFTISQVLWNRIRR